MKTILMSLILVLSVFAIPFVLAIEPDPLDQGVDINKINPDSPFYGLDKAMENLNLAFAPGHKKAEIRIEIAEERFVEAKIMAEENKFEAMQKAQRGHEETLIKVKEDLKNIDPEDDGDSKEKLKRRIEIEQKLNRYEEEIEDFKQEIKIKIEGQLTQEQQALIDQLIASFKGQVGELEIEIENEKGKVKIEIEQEFEDIDADELEDELEDEVGLTAECQEDLSEEIADAKEEIAKAKTKIAEVKNKGGEVLLAEQALTKAEELLNQLKSAESPCDALDLAEEAKDLASESRMKLLGKTSEDFEDDDSDENDDAEDNSGSDNSGSDKVVVLN